MTAAEPADLPFDAALLMGTLQTRLAEERLEPVMGPQRDEPLGLVPVPAFEDSRDSGFEVVVTHPPRDTTEMLERQNVSLQERLLSLGAERDVERPPAVRQAHHEHPHLHQRPADRGVELPEVDLRLRARLMGLRDAYLHLDQVELDPAPGHIPRHAHLRQDGAVLGHQPLPHPPGRVPLLTMHVLVADQPLVDHTGPRVGRRPGPGHVLLTRRRQRGRQRLPHRAAVNLMSLGQLPNRQGLNAPVAPDLLEQLHS